MTKIFVKLVTGHPKKCILFSLSIFCFCSYFIFHLKHDFGVQQWFRTDDPLIAELKSFEKKFGNDENVILALHSEKGIFTNEAIKILQELTEEFWQLPEVTRVDSLANFNSISAVDDEISIQPLVEDGVWYTEEELSRKKSIALKDSQVVDRFISKDGKIAIIFGTLINKEKGSVEYRDVVSKLELLANKYEKKSDLKFFFNGDAVLNESYRKISDSDLRVMLPINFLVMIILLSFIFRSFIGVLLPVGLVFVSIVATFGISGLFNLPFDNLSSAIPGILIAICMADSIHILSTFYRIHGHTKDIKTSVEETISKNLKPTFLTSLTTIIGFLSLLKTTLIPIQKLAFLASFGTAFAWIFTFFLLCPLLLVFPITAGKMKKAVNFSPAFIQSYISWVQQNKKSIILFFFFIGSLSLGLGLKNEVNSDPLEHFHEDTRMSKDSFFFLKEFNGINGPQIVVDSQEADGIKDPNFLNKVEKFISEIESMPYVNKVDSIIETIKKLKMALDNKNQVLPQTRQEVAEILLLYTMGLPLGMGINNQVSLDNRYLRLSVMWSLHDAKSSLAAIDNLNQKAKKLGLNVSFTGKHFLYNRMTGHIVNTFIVSICMATIFIGILMFAILRSKTLGFISLLPNIIPILVGAGVMYLLNKNIDVGTSLVLSVCLGIAVDDTIHFLTDYMREFNSCKNVEQSIVAVFIKTAPALIFTTVILVLGFGVFSFADFIPNANFGILCAIILSFALIVDLVLLPALLLVAHRDK